MPLNLSRILGLAMTLFAEVDSSKLEDNPNSVCLYDKWLLRNLQWFGFLKIGFNVENVVMTAVSKLNARR